MVGTNGYGETYNSLLKSMNTYGRGAFIKPVRESTGFIFFGRPSLNLSYNNLKMSRHLSKLNMGSAHNTIPHYIRMLLDPKLALAPENSDCVLIDPELVWNPLLSTTCKELSGWDDQVMDYTTSEPGKLRQTYSIADGTAHQYGHFVLNATFTNPYGNPLSLLFSSLMHYMGAVHDEVMLPYASHMLSNERDYDMTIFRLVMDEQNKYVLSIGWTVGSLMSNPNGARLNFSEDTGFSEDSQNYSVSFSCDGALIDDPICFEVFNAFNGMTNPKWRENTLTTYYTKCENISEAHLFKEKIYPWINQDTAELEWWVDTALYNSVLGE